MAAVIQEFREKFKEASEELTKSPHVNELIIQGK